MEDYTTYTNQQLAEALSNQPLKLKYGTKTWRAAAISRLSYTVLRNASFSKKVPTRSFRRVTHVPCNSKICMVCRCRYLPIIGDDGMCTVCSD